MPQPRVSGLPITGAGTATPTSPGWSSAVASGWPMAPQPV